MKLNIIPTKKLLKVNGREVYIPKLGIRHRQMIDKLNENPVKALSQLLKTIDSKLTNAEAEYVLLHLLVYNGLVPESYDVDGFDYNMNNVYIDVQTKFTLNGKDYKFKQPRYNHNYKDAIDALNKLTLDGIDFNNEQAAVLLWTSKLLGTIAIDTPAGKIKGLNYIIGVSNG